ncbi:MAG: 50S ribosomal protein L6 [Alphaproteobacteria bacterium]|nr:50S ribosomal protein L6 [Alphaproteobacteria bacterium]
MSRIGKKPVTVPQGVNVALAGQDLTVKGKKGELKLRLVDDLRAKVGDGKVALLPVDKASKRGRMMWGMQRSLVQNMMRGVSEGFSEQLEISGVGFRAQLQGKVLQLQLGFSHQVDYAVPADIEIKVDKQTSIAIAGIDRQKVGQVAAEIRALRKPEPYQGKGIRYGSEVVRRKEGKKK